MRIPVNNLIPGTPYVFQFRAVDAKGNTSDWSKAYSLTTTTGSMAPAAPVLNSWQINGTSYGASWGAVSTKQDTTPLTDLDHYVLYIDNGTQVVTYKVSGSTTTFDFSYEQQLMWFLAPQGSLSLTITAVDKFGSESVRSNAIVASVSPPPVPSAPTLESGPGFIAISWNGKNANGSNAGNDFKRIIIHMHAGSGSFAVSSATNSGATIESVGGTMVVPVPDTSTYSFELVQVNQLGGQSAPSTAVSGSGLALSADPSTFADQSINGSKIIAGTILGNRILAGSITAANAVFQTGAIQSADIGSLTADKITTGVLSAIVTMSGRIMTGSSGARVEMRGASTGDAGFFAYNPSGSETVRIDTNGNVFLNGSFTSTSGSNVTNLNSAAIYFRSSSIVVPALSLSTGYEVYPSQIYTYSTGSTSELGIVGPTISSSAAGSSIHLYGGSSGGSITAFANNGITLTQGAKPTFGSAPSTLSSITMNSGGQIKFLGTDVGRSSLALQFGTVSNGVNTTIDTFGITTNSLNVNGGISAPAKMQAGFVDITSGNAGTVGTAPIGFAAGFTSAPSVVLTASSGSANYRSCSVTNIGPGGCTANIVRNDSGVSTRLFWIAVAP